MRSKYSCAAVTLSVAFDRSFLAFVTPFVASVAAFDAPTEFRTASLYFFSFSTTSSSFFFVPPLPLPPPPSSVPPSSSAARSSVLVAPAATVAAPPSDSNFALTCIKSFAVMPICVPSFFVSMVISGMFGMSGIALNALISALTAPIAMFARACFMSSNFDTKNLTEFTAMFPRPLKKPTNRSGRAATSATIAPPRPTISEPPIVPSHFTIEPVSRAR